MPMKLRKTYFEEKYPFSFKDGQFYIEKILQKALSILKTKNYNKLQILVNGRYYIISLNFLICDALHEKTFKSANVNFEIVKYVVNDCLTNIFF